MYSSAIQSPNRLTGGQGLTCLLHEGSIEVIVSMTAKEKLMKTLVIATGLLVFISTAAHAQMQTLVVSPSNTNSAVVTVSSNSYAVIKSVHGDGDLVVTVQGLNFTLEDVGNNFFIAGPATIQLRAHCCAFYESFATVEVISSVNQIMPSTAVVIPADAGGPVKIILESSTDLLNWTAALPGTYGTSTTNRFFRVRAERTQ